MYMYGSHFEGNVLVFFIGTSRQQGEYYQAARTSSCVILLTNKRPRYDVSFDGSRCSFEAFNDAYSGHMSVTAGISMRLPSVTQSS